jgi:hypothetical protein
MEKNRVQATKEARSAVRQSSKDLALPRLQELAQQVMLSQALAFLLDTGMPPQELAACLRAQAAQLEHGKLTRCAESKSAQLAHVTFNASQVTRQWTCDVDFTGADGEPRVLPLYGRHSLSTLIKAYFPRSRVRAAVRWMCTHQLIEQIPRGRYRLLSRTVLVGQPDPVQFGWTVWQLCRHLSTAVENLKTSNLKNRHLHRVARVLHLPPAKIAKFREFAKGRAGSWLEEIDDWLQDHDAATPARGGVEVGVHVYSYAVPKRSNGDRSTRGKPLEVSTV